MSKASFFPNSEGYPVLCSHLHFSLVGTMVIITETDTEGITWSSVYVCANCEIHPKGAWGWGRGGLFYLLQVCT